MKTPPSENSAIKPDSANGQRHAVFLVEDHPITEAGLATLVNREREFYICGSADNAPVALEKISKLRPAIVVSDIALKTSNGIELMKNLVAICPEIPILAMSMHDETLYAERAIRAGAHGYISKSEAVDRFLPAIRAILAGDIYLSDRMKGKLLNRMVRYRRGDEKIAFPLDSLSDRELEVFQLIGNGFTTREIADRLNLSTKTIDSYREHLKTKLGLENGAELARRAINWSRFETPMAG